MSCVESPPQKKRRNEKASPRWWWSLPDAVALSIFSPSSATIPMAATRGMDKKLVIWDLQHSTPRFICDHACDERLS
ncbi:unnamed protein product [Brassica rapa subsp. trilocularis]